MPRVDHTALHALPGSFLAQQDSGPTLTNRAAVVLTRRAEPAHTAHDADAPPTRSVAARRRALPNGRAVVGGLLVAAAAVGTYAAWSGADEAPSTRYAVAVRDLAVGEVVEAGDLELVPLELASRVAAGAFEGDDAALVPGQLTVAPVAEGDLVQRSALIVPEDARPARQLSFAIDLSAALAGTLEQGEHIDVLVTTGGDDEAATRVVARDAVVARLVGDGDDGRLVVLLSVDESTDLAALVTAARRGELTLVRATPGSGAGD
jgi:hypothetical protein